MEFLFYALFIIPIALYVFNKDKKETEELENKKAVMEPAYKNVSYDSRKKHLTVYKRCKENGEVIGVDGYKGYFFTAVPEKLIFTSATVGGITTGGVHRSGGYTNASSLKSGSHYAIYYMHYEGDKLCSDEIETISFSGKYNYKNSKISKYVKDNKIIVVENTNQNYMYQKYGMAAIRSSDPKIRNEFNAAETADHPTKEKCLDIVSWICGID